MKSFQNIIIKGFRRLLDVNLELRPLTVMIGANGAGKTSILDVFSLLSASADGKLDEKLSELGGFDALRTFNKAQMISFYLSMTVPNYNPLEYELMLALKGQEYEIRAETLCQKKTDGPIPFKHIDSVGSDIRYFEVKENKLLRPNWEYKPFETSLSQVPKMFQEPEEFRQMLTSTTHYHSLDVSPNAPVRRPQQMRPAKLPGKAGEDLVSCLYYLRETDRDRFEAIEDALKASFPGFVRLDFPPVAAGTIAMTWKDSNFSHPFYTHQLSEGTLRFLWLATLLQSPGLTAVTLLDEPEVSLHPEMLSLLAGLMQEASQRTQLIVATHSDRLVRFLKPSEVVVMGIEDDGCAKMTRADQMDIDKWLKDYSLDQVWDMGLLEDRA